MRAFGPRGTRERHPIFSIQCRRLPFGTLLEDHLGLVERPRGFILQRLLRSCGGVREHALVLPLVSLAGAPSTSQDDHWSSTLHWIRSSCEGGSKASPDRRQTGVSPQFRFTILRECFLKVVLVLAVTWEMVWRLLGGSLGTICDDLISHLEGDSASLEANWQSSAQLQEPSL